jgi:hypothetical protein
MNFITIDLASDLRAYVAGRRDSKRGKVLLLRIRALLQPRRLEILEPLLKTGERRSLWFDHAQLARGDYIARTIIANIINAVRRAICVISFVVTGQHSARAN